MASGHVGFLQDAISPEGAWVASVLAKLGDIVVRQETQRWATSVPVCLAERLTKRRLVSELVHGLGVPVAWAGG